MKLYKWHVKNLQEIELAINNTARAARIAIAQKNRDKNLQSLIRLYSFLIGAWAECRLKKLLHERSTFTDDEKDLILLNGDKKRSQLDQWLFLIELSFRKHHKLTKGKLNKINLGVVNFARFEALTDVLNEDLRIIIEIRNKLAHGQWVYPLNDKGDKVDDKKYQLINKENLLSLQFKYSLINNLADIIHDLIVTPPTFTRDFDIRFKKIYQLRVNLKKRKYEKYESNLINNYQKGRQ